MKVYEGCASDVRTKDPAQNWISLTFSENGVPKSCSYFPKGCADDCTTGFDITTLEFL